MHDLQTIIRLNNEPVSQRTPALAKAHQISNEARSKVPRQNYWRCEHFPSAIENFFEGHDCACRDSTLESWQNGVHRL